MRYPSHFQEIARSFAGIWERIGPNARGVIRFVTTQSKIFIVIAKLLSRL